MIAKASGAIGRERIGRIRGAPGLGDRFGGSGFDAHADVAIGFRSPDLFGVALGFQTARRGVAFRSIGSRFRTVQTRLGRPRQPSPEIVPTPGDQRDRHQQGDAGDQPAQRRKGAGHASFTVTGTPAALRWIT